MCHVLWVQLWLFGHFFSEIIIHTNMLYTFWHKFWTPVWLWKKPTPFFSRTVQQLTPQAILCLQSNKQNNKRKIVASLFADLNPHGFYLWNMLKDEVSSNNPRTENDMGGGGEYHSGCSVFSFFSQTWMCNNQHVCNTGCLFVSWRKPVQPPSLDMVCKSLILTALKQTKTFQYLL